MAAAAAAVAGGGGGGGGGSGESSGGLMAGGSGNGRAQYVSATCVVFTHYSGDAASVVDEHFSRALNFSDKNNKGKCTGAGVFFLPFYFCWFHLKGASIRHLPAGRGKYANATLQMIYT